MTTTPVLTPLPEGCLFYHAMDLPGVGSIPGVWDHRATAEDYLGGVDFAGRRVLEIGPANGFFSFELERRGGRVVALELGDTSDWDRVPQVYFDDHLLQAALRANVSATQKAWAFAHARLGSRAESVRGTVYQAPELVDRVDVALLGNVLQHLRDPLLALARVAEVTTEAIVVSEAMWYDTPEFRRTPCMMLIPRADVPEANHSWWNVSPALVIETLKLLGFPRIRCEFHHQQFNGASLEAAAARQVSHFTVVGRRMVETRGVSVAYGQGWYDEEVGGRHRWRWTSGRRATLALRCEEPRTVEIAFGVQGVEPGREIGVSIGGIELWRRTAHGVCSVSLHDVRLPRGESVLELEMEGLPVAVGHRPLGMRLYDFGVAPSS
jgi:hypothetical protein